MKASINATTFEWKVSGLPSLSVPIGADGYFDGYILTLQDWSLASLTSDAAALSAISAGAEILSKERLVLIKKGSLGMVRLMRGDGFIWARVYVLDREDVRSARVYLIDVGVEKLVNTRDIYALPNELRTAPTSFPVSIDSFANFPAYDVYAFEKFDLARVTVKFDKVAKDRLEVDEVNVYDKETHFNVDLRTAALKNIELEQFNSPSKLLEKGLSDGISDIATNNATRIGFDDDTVDKFFPLILFAIVGMFFAAIAILMQLPQPEEPDVFLDEVLAQPVERQQRAPTEQITKDTARTKACGDDVVVEHREKPMESINANVLAKLVHSMARAARTEEQEDERGSPAMSINPPGSHQKLRLSAESFSSTLPNPSISQQLSTNISMLPSKTGRDASYSDSLDSLASSTKSNISIASTINAAGGATHSTSFDYRNYSNPMCAKSGLQTTDARNGTPRTSFDSVAEFLLKRYKERSGEIVQEDEILRQQSEEESEKSCQDLSFRTANTHVSKKPPPPTNQLK